MKVSFIVPVYKKSPEIFHRCLKSLFDQAYKDIEVICVFDGKDDLLQGSIVDFPEVEEIKFVEIEHGGAPKARNAGLDVATGEIIVFWDADCIIEPDICGSWVKLFQERKDIDFIYGNYGILEHPEAPGHRGEPFDTWKLTKYNYIGTMSAIRKEKAIRWDETLEGLQDWDYFRTLAENGCRGGWLDHKFFDTEMPVEGAISHGKREQAIARIKAVKEKHGDEEKDILVVPGLPYHEAERIAKYLDADIFNMDLWRIKKYKTIVMIGFTPDQPQLLNWAYRDDDAKNILFWMGGEAENLLGQPWGLTQMLIKAVNKIVHKHYCTDKGTKDRLAEMGIEAELIDIPRDEGEVSKELPPEFKVLIYGDDKYKQLTDSIVEAMPDISFTKLEANAAIKLTDYTLYVQFEHLGQCNDAVRTMLVNGRHVISNVQSPYAGYVPLGESIDGFKGEIINAIRAVKKEHKYNQEAHDYWLNATFPQYFASKIKGVPVMEVA